MTWRVQCSVWLVFIGLAGCFSPSFEDGKIQCGPAGQCPPGLSCVAGVCRTGSGTPMVTLTVSPTSGTGSGTVTSMPGGITCPATCDASFPAGTTVMLSAAADTGSTFTGWGGACSGATACALTLTADTTVSADFEHQHTVTVTTTGPGTGMIASTPAGITCPGTCAYAFTDGTMVSLTATPTAPAMFAGWSGAGCSGTGTCAFTVSGDVAIQAAFAANDTLVVSKAGTGTGTVTSSPSGIACGTTCSQMFPVGSMVTLTAAADANSTFTGWSGACSGTGTCTVTIAGAEMVTATFTRKQYALTVTKTGTGSGTVTSNPAGVSCGTSCSATYDSGTMVTLTAAPATGSTFAGWSGAGCSGTGTCTVTMSQAQSVSAAFTLDRFALTVTEGGAGSGTVTSTPAGISCGTTCAASFDYNTMVTLTATPATGSTFAGWSGGGCSGTGTCTVTITAAVTVGATFQKASFPLTITKSGGGTGTVTSNPAGISCGTTCMASYVYDTVVTLTATTSGGSVFVGWSGGGCSGTGTCSVTVVAAVTVTAAFSPPPNIEFVTSGTVAPGSLGGIANADAFCQNAASTAGLAGTYKAWLSSTTVNAVDRLGSASGWVRTDGAPFANTASDLANAHLFHPPLLDEHGVSLGNVFVDTATTVGGKLDPNSSDCGGYTTSTTGVDAGPLDITFGYTAGDSSLFEVAGSTGCASAEHLLCLGVDRTATVVPPAPTTPFRRAFMRLWAPGGGIAAADADCQSTATAAGLPGTYLALLPTTTQSALGRFDTTGAPWVRVDNVPVLSSAGAWSSATFFDVSPSLSADGMTWFGNFVNWNGASSLTVAGSLASTCSNWTDTTGTALSSITGTSQITGPAGSGPSFWSALGSTSCGFTSGAITCLQK